MAGPLVVGAEGVILIPDKDSYAASRPIMEGVELVSQLRHFPTSRVTVLVGTADIEGAAYFLKSNGLNDVGIRAIALEDKDQSPELAQWYSIRRQRSLGPINLIITAYTTVFRSCTESHQPVLLYARRGSVPTGEELPSWDELQERVKKRRDAVVEAS